MAIRSDARFIRLEAFDDEQNHVWVYFAHTCLSRAMREDRVEFFTAPNYYELNSGYCAEGCCNVVVPMDVWHRWVRRSELVKAVQRARAAPQDGR